MTEALFRDEQYRDDRMFVTHVCKCTVRKDPDGTITTSIHHEEAPPNHIWCVVTYRNTRRYPIFRVNHFASASDAHEYLMCVEPQTPLVSLDGQSPATPLSYDQYVAWKVSNNWKEFDYTQVFSPGGSNPTEVVVTRAS